MRTDIDAIAFDIDGTLYPDGALYLRLIPFLLTNFLFLSDFGWVRNQIRLWQEAHPGEKQADFMSWQAELMAPLLGCESDEAKARLDAKIYRGWTPLFAKIKPFAHLKESFAAFRASGLKIGILSDFLPSQKGDIWGLAALSDVVMGSEETGALKPSPVPFLALAEALALPPSRILYVGNSVTSDVRGAAAVGMKTACLVHPLMLRLGRTVREADISFSDYRQLTRIVLK